MAEDASSVKCLVSNFNDYEMVDSRPMMEKFHQILRILWQFTQHNFVVPMWHGFWQNDFRVFKLEVKELFK
ncbi:unnamed protein product [Rhodiola kirilowii]